MSLNSVFAVAAAYVLGALLQAAAERVERDEYFPVVIHVIVGLVLAVATVMLLMRGWQA